VALPGDKSISHRAALFALLAGGPCTAAGWLDSQDTLSSMQAVVELGGTAEFRDGVLHIAPPVARSGGSYAEQPNAPVDEPNSTHTIDCGNSGTTVRLLMGLLAGWLPGPGQPGLEAVRLVGDESLSARPMARVVDPLRQMGANIKYEDHEEREGKLPLVVCPAQLSGVHHHLKVPSAQVKSALQLAGLFATGETSVAGADGARDHTERLLAVMGLDRQGNEPSAFQITVPADPSAAAFFQVAAALIPNSRITTKDLSLNPGRAGALDVLRLAGALVEIDQTVFDPAEPMGTVTVAHGQLRPFTVTGKEVPSLIDELPVLAVLATQANGTTRISGAADLRVKECDRVAVMASELKKIGADITEHEDGWTINGPTPLKGGPSEKPVVISTFADHRIAMSFAVAALIAEGHLALDDEKCVGVSFPEFFITLEALLGI